MPDDPRTDDELVRAINAGPPEAEGAFAALYHRHKQWATRVATRLAPSHTDPSDLVQDSFITLLRQFPGFQLRGRLTTFLYPVIRNRALAASRKRGRGPDRGAPGPGWTSTTPSDEFSGLRAAVAALPESQREVLLMRLVDDMDVSEVALALGVPTGTVKSRLHTALAALRSDPGAQAWFASE